MANLLSLAFYLPQFHQIPENDEWWGCGFTEWTHLERALQWYPGHEIRRPVDPLGHYSLLDPATLEAQQALASAHGIDGFLVWNYWFGGGQQLLQRPVDLILEQGLQVNHAFAWANHDWIDKAGKRVLARQHYLGKADYTAYFHRCLPHFESERYIKVDGKPFFFIYRPEHLPDLPVFIDTWRTLAVQHGLPGLYVVGDMLKSGTRPPAQLDLYSCSAGIWENRKVHRLGLLQQTVRRRLGIQTEPQRFDFSSLVDGFEPRHAPARFMPTVFTGWDTTPRHGRNGVIVDGLTPGAFRDHLAQVQAQLLRQQGATRIVLIKSWNEWAEGNLLEPDSVHGDALLREYHRFVLNCRVALGDEG